MIFPPAILLAPGPNQNFSVPSGASYLSNSEGLIYNPVISDIPSLILLGCEYLTPRNNITMTSGPSSSDDFTQSYGIGSYWIYINGTLVDFYVCTAMLTTPGGATWTLVASTTDIGTVVYTVNVANFGALGNGVHDDTTAIQAAINSVGGNGGSIAFNTGTFLISSALTLPSNVTLVGNGRGATIIQAASGATNFNMIQTTGFLTLIGTNTVGGTYKNGVRDMSLNGNKAGRSGTGHGLAIYGIDYNLTNVEIYDCPTDGLYSEWATSGTVPTFNGDSMEAHVHGLKCWSNTRNGISWNGPHDSVVEDIQVFLNGQYGLSADNTANYTCNGTTFDDFHSYGNTGHGVLINGEVIGVNFQSESNGGDGIHITDTVFGFFQATGVMVFNNTGNGLNLTAGFANITGIQAYLNGAQGVVTTAALTLSDGKIYNNGTTGLLLNTGADASTLADLEIFSNTGIGFQTNAACAISGLYVHNNGSDGIRIAHSDCSITGIRCENNTGNGINVSTSVSDIVLSGKSSGNTDQFTSLSNISAPAIIDIGTFNTAGGQTSYSGTVGNYYARIGTAGTGALSPVTQVQT